MAVARTISDHRCSCDVCAVLRAPSTLPSFVVSRLSTHALVSLLVPHAATVPIIPAFLFELHHKADMVVLNETLRTSTPSPAAQYNARMAAMYGERPNLMSRYTPPTARQQLGVKRKCVCRDGEDEGYFEPVLDEIAYQTTEPPTTTTEAVTTTTMSPETAMRHEELVQENFGNYIWRIIPVCD